jgi:hypothetical protein
MLSIGSMSSLTGVVRPATGNRTTVSVRFGTQVDLIGSLIQGAMQNSANPNDPTKKNKSTWKKFFWRQVAPTALVTAILANGDFVWRMIENANHRFNGKPLESVLAKKETPPPDKAPEPLPHPLPVSARTPQDLINALRKPWAILPSTTLLEAARTGMVKEVRAPDTDKLLAPGIPAWTAILIDGTVVYTEIDDKVRDKLVNELKVPVAGNFTGLSLSFPQAAMIALFLVNAVGVMLQQRDEKLTVLTEADKDRVALTKAGRFLVSAELDVSSEPLKKDRIEEELILARINESYKPSDLLQIKKQLAVLMAGDAIERRLLDNNPSIGANTHREEAYQIAHIMITRLGMDKLYEHGTAPNETTEAQKVQTHEAALAILKEATALAMAQIEKHSPDQIRNLQNGVKELKGPISREETLALLGGKSVKDIQTERYLTTRLMREIRKRL